jgi:hypothetical protein
MQGSSIVKIDVQATSGVCLAMPSAEPHGLIDETNCNLPRLGTCIAYTLYDAPLTGVPVIIERTKQTN